MRSLVVLLALGAGLGALAVVACGGDAKPPLTPDTVDTSSPTEGAEAGAPPATTANPPAAK